MVSFSDNSWTTCPVICAHMFKEISKFNHNQYKFEIFLKIFKVQLQLHKVGKISKNFQSPVQVNWIWKKNSKKCSKFNSSKTWVKNFQSFKVQMPGCEMSENSENIPSPNQRWLNKENFQSLNPKTNGWKPKNKFEVQTGWDIFKLFLNIYRTTLSSMVNQCTHKICENEIIWFQSQMKFTNAKNISTQIQLSSKCKYKLFKMDDIWPLTYENMWLPVEV